MQIIKYPDGSSYVKADVELIGEINHEITFKVNSYEDLWHLNQYVDAFYNYNKQKPTIIIPNLIDAQADRRFSDNQSSGLKLVCDFLNNMYADFKIFHPHNPEVVEALMDNVIIIDNLEFIVEVLDSISNPEPLDVNNWRDNKNLILFSSDAGGFKPLMKLCDKIGWEGETYSASKARTYKNKSTQLEQFIDKQDFDGRDILIVDDICVYGGTFKGLSKMLRERNCGKLYLAVSHVTVQNIGEDPVTNYFDKVFTTNSKFDKYYTENEDPYANALGHQPENLEIIKLF